MFFIMGVLEGVIGEHLLIGLQVILGGITLKND